MTRSRTPVVIAAVLVVVAVVGLLAVVLTRGASDDAADSTSTSTSTAAATSPGTDTASTAVGPVPSDIVYGAVEVSGQPLPEFTGEETDPAIGMAAPAVAGTTYAGESIEIVPGQGGPMMVVFLAHWCPHCNAEIPVLNEWRDSGAIPADLRVVGVSTSVTDQRPNFPPAQWLADRAWTWPALADDETSSALAAYGGTGFPYFVVIGADGTVRARNAGELPIDQLTALVATALA